MFVDRILNPMAPLGEGFSHQRAGEGEPNPANYVLTPTFPA